MSSLYWFLVIFAIILQFVLPTKYAFLPLLLVALHIGPIQVLNGVNAYRIIIVVGLFRAVFGGSIFRAPPRCALDLFFVLFFICAIVSGLGHSSRDGNPFVFRAGLSLDILGSYLYGRSFLTDIPSIERLASSLAILIIPLAVLLVTEIIMGSNPYYYLGSGVQDVAIRADKARALGPFRHPILTGTAGATAIPLMVWVFKSRKLLGSLGIAAAATITFSSQSSGPFAVLLVATCGMYLWRWRSSLTWTAWQTRFKLIASVAVFLPLAYTLYSGSGPWYLLARIDLVGGSTGWHRAYLIDQAFKHLSEWWLTGTDVTRHWMPTGVSWSEYHVDITNYYIHLGVIGGLGLTVLCVVILCLSFYYITVALRGLTELSNQHLAWAIGVTLFAHAVSFISISYLGQMFVLYYLAIACIPAIYFSSKGVQTCSSDTTTAGDDNVGNGSN